MLKEKNAADRFEAYLTALEFSNGHKALLKFIVPLIRREFFDRFDSIPSLIVGPTGPDAAEQDSSAIG